MKRRHFIRQTAVLGVAAPLAVRTLAEGVGGLEVGPREPVFVYNNWSAYDELSDKVVQTEVLAMRELGEILRLRRTGVQIDYYVMDAFWFDKMGGYRVWNHEHWPNGPDRWLEGCRLNKIRPGMWFSTNLIATHDGRFLEPVPEWQDSVGTDPNILCLFEGGYLPHLAGTLQGWYDKGVRLFKFDFAYFEAVTPASKDKFTPEEIKEKNKVAFMQMLQTFRRKNPDVLITGYNGFGGDMENTFTPFDKKIDQRWLDTFDTLYCGDPRFSDVPMMNIWRSQDNYSDHQVSAYQAYGMPIRRIDNCAFMCGTTGTCYYRGAHAWKGMLLLELARGGWMNVYHGNLELLSLADGHWFARAQGLYHALQRLDRISTFGAVPGTGKPYGFKGVGPKGAVYTMVNPSQDWVMMGEPWKDGGEGGGGMKVRVLYADGGYMPEIVAVGPGAGSGLAAGSRSGSVRVGPEQLVVVGTGAYADAGYDLGRDETIKIPMTQDRVEVAFVSAGKNMIHGFVRVGAGKNLRILVQQFGANGLPVRSWGGSPPDGKKMDTLIQIRARQGGADLLLFVEYNKMIWSGLSWGAAELRQGTFDASLPVEIECYSAEKDELRLEGRVYANG
jgi:hypothetical protein